MCLRIIYIRSHYYCQSKSIKLLQNSQNCTIKAILEQYCCYPIRFTVSLIRFVALTFQFNRRAGVHCQCRSSTEYIISKEVKEVVFTWLWRSLEDSTILFSSQIFFIFVLSRFGVTGGSLLTIYHSSPFPEWEKRIPT